MSGEHTKPVESRTEDNHLELSNFAREWLNELRRDSGGYSAEVLRHIHAQADEIERLRALVPGSDYHGV
jgi:hypothetical protein